MKLTAWLLGCLLALTLSLLNSITPCPILILPLTRLEPTPPCWPRLCRVHPRQSESHNRYNNNNSSNSSSSAGVAVCRLPSSPSVPRLASKRLLSSLPRLLQRMRVMAHLHMLMYSSRLLSQPASLDRSVPSSRAASLRSITKGAWYPLRTSTNVELHRRVQTPRALRPRSESDPWTKLPSPLKCQMAAQ